AGKSTLEEEDVRLNVGDLIQEGLCLSSRGDVRGRLRSLLQAHQGLRQLAGEHQQHGLGKTQAWMRPDESIWQGLQPVQHCVSLATQGKRVRVLFNQADHALDIGSKPRVMHRFDDQVMLLVPGTGATMQFRNEGGRRLVQTAPQQVGEQVVVAVPLSLVVEGGHKQVGPLEGLQHRLALLLSSDRVTERTREAFQNRGLQQKRLHRGGLPGEHFLGEVIQHEVMAAGEGGDKTGDSGASLQRERGQLQTSNPALRPGL
ncbi:MAG TPA: hypothetical protein VFZ02_04550, partial [Ktedonobacteraceae bacterium]